MKTAIEIAIDKTANFVSKNGEQFEDKLKIKFTGNPIYSFLDLLVRQVSRVSWIASRTISVSFNP